MEFLSEVTPGPWHPGSSNQKKSLYSGGKKKKVCKPDPIYVINPFLLEVFIERVTILKSIRAEVKNGSWVHSSSDFNLPQLFDETSYLSIKC